MKPEKKEQGNQQLASEISRSVVASRAAGKGFGHLVPYNRHGGRPCPTYRHRVVHININSH